MRKDYKLQVAVPTPRTPDLPSRQRTEESGEPVCNARKQESGDGALW